MKELLAAGARKFLTTLDNIEGLSWSWDSGLEETIRKKGSVSPVRFRELLDLKPKFLKLKNLLLHVPLAINVAPTDLIVCSFTSFVYLISLCQNLEQLWILSWPKTVQERKSSSNFFQEVFETDDIDLPKLKVLVVAVKDPPRIHIPPRRGITQEERVWPALDFSLMERFSLPLMPDALRLTIPKPFPTCKALHISHGLPTIINLNGTFDGAVQLESLCCEAFNFKMDWKRLSMFHPNIKEINLSKNEGVLYPDYCVALAHMTKLKRISIPVEALVEIKDAKILSEFADCVPPNDNSTSNEPQSYTVGFKKRRVGVSVSNKPSVGVSGLQLLTNRCSYVEEIEIGYSSKSCHAGRLLSDSLFYISQWKFLKKISLDGVPIKHGKFLIEIAKATSLESVRLSNVGPTGRCAYITDLSEAVRHCPQLKDLRLQQNYMGSVTSLLHALQNCSNLHEYCFGLHRMTPH
ncbi:F-box/LRR-repeat protein 18 [Orchesella cincta]|uniref:F-box/LRR-repeat protein 18 n=1 Tax=Orchesella cincta TaxID=48709 RepID=A0A1D2MG21_ORCCI|nr:F-box/LRR-repeat protein 18 [Orchesella cincta]